MRLLADYRYEFDGAASLATPATIISHDSPTEDHQTVGIPDVSSTATTLHETGSGEATLGLVGEDVKFPKQESGSGHLNLDGVDGDG